MGVDFARHLHGGVVAVIASAQRPAQRIGLLLRPRRAHASGLAATLPLALAHLLLKLLGEALGALAHGVEGAALAVDGAVRIALAERAFGVAHGLVGLAERVIALTLALTLAGLLALALLPLSLLTLPLLLALALVALLVLAEAALLHVFQ